MEQKINQILRKFKIEELIKKLKMEDKNFDTEIFGIFKVHYQEIFSSEKLTKIHIKENRKNRNRKNFK